MTCHAAVLGAGLQGACVAMALAGAGWRVTLVDKAAGPMRRASLRNEGKLHLGFMYGNDPSRRTPRLMLRGAFAFGPLLEQWLGPVDWRGMASEPFSYYAVHGSLVPPDALRQHFALLEAERREVADAPYVGLRPDRLWLDDPQASPIVDPAYAQPLGQTAEIALDTADFADTVRRAVGSAPAIGPRYGAAVIDVRATPAGFAVDIAEGSPVEADIVVNCLWEGRLAIDATLGIMPPRPWVHRLKYRVIVRPPDFLRGSPSMSFLLGPYCEFVSYRDGRMYLSFYPECLRGWSEALAPPPDWDAPCDGAPDPDVAAAVAAGVLRALDRVVPGVGASEVLTVDAGAIFGWGESDITDPASALHERHDTGVHAHGGYFSIDTGKLVTAPLFAQDLLRLVSGG